MSQQINLFNPIFKQQKKYLSALTMAQALGLILLGSLLLTGYATYRTHRMQTEVAALAAQLSAAQNLQRKIEAEYPSRRQSKLLESEIQQTEASLRSLQSVAHILQQGELGNTKGYADYFRAFARQIVGGVWITGLSIHGAGAEIELKGRAVNPELVPFYIGRLKAEPVVQGKSFSSLEMHVPQTVGIIPAGGAGPSANFIEFTLQSTGISAQADKTAVGGK
jgi:hypothetical protein